MLFKKIVIAQHERGLYLKNKTIVRILEPGVHRIFSTGVHVEVLDIRELFVENEWVSILVDTDRAFAEKYFQVIDLGESELALVYKDTRLKNILSACQRHIFWKDAPGLDVKIIDTQKEHLLETELATTIRQSFFASEFVYDVTVNAESIGLLWIDGKLVDTFAAGSYMFWAVNRQIKFEHLDMRVQMLEVSGQEILTKDKVSLRINLSAAYRLIDPVRAKTKLQDFNDYLYKRLQFALRESVATRTLDILLMDKSALNKELDSIVKSHLIEFGIKVENIGVKDIILPGEMKDILNKVVATEKAAQANIIRRREETAATRSLLNTAKLMDENPMLLRLKEIEALEKVVEKVEKLTVYDGLDGLLKDTVKLRV